MDLLERLLARWTIGRQLCANCRTMPRRPDLTLPDVDAAFSTVDPAAYCSVECAREADARSAW